MTEPAVIAEDVTAVAATLLLVDPIGLGGMRVHGPADDARGAFITTFRAAMPPATAWIRIPASITLDRLVGGLDLTATLAAGRIVAERGVLAAAHGGFAVLASAERLPGAAIGPIVHAMDTGRAVVQRDGIQSDLPAEFALVVLDESEGDEPGLDASIRDRLAFLLRVPTTWAHDPVVLPDADEILAARSILPTVTCADEWIGALISAADAFGVASPRALLFASRAARASAALERRTAVDESDVQRAVALVLIPRATRIPAEAPPPAPPPPAPDSPEENTAQDDSLATPPDAPDTESPDALSGDEQRELAERVIAAAASLLPPDMLAGLDSGRVRSGRSGSGRTTVRTKTAQHGRTVGNEAGMPRGGRRLDLLATLRAAAPWQRLRSAERPVGADPTMLLVRGSDLRVRRLAQRVGTTMMVAVDASGSAAAQRLGEAKGAVELLLAESYVRRDQVALVSFRGKAAELILPPTRSLARAKRTLAGLPGGGGTPLAAALSALVELGCKVRRDGGRPLGVMLTDGRANVALDGTGGRPRAEAEARRAARQVAAAGIPLLILDTGARPNPALQEIARLADADYLPLPNARADRVRDAVRATSDRRPAA